MSENPTSSGWPFEQASRNRFGAVAHFDHRGRAAVPPQHGGQIAHAEIALVLEADERHARPAPS